MSHQQVILSAHSPLTYVTNVTMLCTTSSPVNLQAKQQRSVDCTPQAAHTERRLLLARETETVLKVLFSVPITKTCRLFVSLGYSLFAARIDETYKNTAWENSRIFKSEQLADAMMTACDSLTVTVDSPDRHTGDFSTEISNFCRRLIHLFKILRHCETHGMHVHRQRTIR